MYDALVFHGAEKLNFLNARPERRHLKQLYIFGILEPPVYTQQDLSLSNNFFNLTMSYRCAFLIILCR